MTTPTSNPATPAGPAGAESAGPDGNARTRRSHLAAAVLTFVVIAASSLCFCAKGIFIKIGYRDGLDTITVLMLRNLLALPFFLGGLAWSEWRAHRTGAGRLSGVDLGRVLALGFVGYYLSSLINFLGLQHVSVGLERMILYTYPSMVMLGSAYFFGQTIKPAAVAALGVAYAGLALGFWGELRVGPQGNLPLGAALVFGSALTYAAFTMVSGEMVRRLGATRLMSWVLVASAVMVLVHYAVTHSVPSLAALPGSAWKLGGTLALVGTVIPSYLFGWGLQRAGATASAVIGMVGPVGTVALAAIVLGERVTFMQLAGLVLTLGGGVAMSLLKRATPAPASPPRE